MCYLYLQKKELCNHKHACWSDVNDGKGLRAFQYSTGKRYLTKVEKEPNVEEVK